MEMKKYEKVYLYTALCTLCVRICFGYSSVVSPDEHVQHANSMFRCVISAFIL